jgi:hypothetical protein
MQPVQANGMYVLRKGVQMAATGSCVRRLWRCCPPNVMFTRILFLLSVDCGACVMSMYVPRRKILISVRVHCFLIETGTTVISDCWTPYRNVEDHGYTHQSMNHMIALVDEWIVVRIYFLCKVSKISCGSFF